MVVKNKGMCCDFHHVIRWGKKDFWKCVLLVGNFDDGFDASLFPRFNNFVIGFPAVIGSALWNTADLFLHTHAQ